jgi:hypothetical protein
VGGWVGGVQDPIPVSFLELEKQLKQREHSMRLFRKPPILDLSEFSAMAIHCGKNHPHPAVNNGRPDR